MVLAKEDITTRYHYSPVLQVPSEAACRRGRARAECRFHSGQPVFERANLLLLSLDGGVLFLEFIQERRIEPLIFDRFHLPIRIPSNDIRVDLGHFFSD